MEVERGRRGKERRQLTQVVEWLENGVGGPLIVWIRCLTLAVFH
jgi:hypothetical protein